MSQTETQTSEIVGRFTQAFDAKLTSDVLDGDEWNVDGTYTTTDETVALLSPSVETFGGLALDDYQTSPDATYDVMERETPITSVAYDDHRHFVTVSKDRLETAMGVFDSPKIVVCSMAHIAYPLLVIDEKTGYKIVIAPRDIESGILGTPHAEPPSELKDKKQKAERKFKPYVNEDSEKCEMSDCNGHAQYVEKDGEFVICGMCHQQVVGNIAALKMF